MNDYYTDERCKDLFFQVGLFLAGKITRLFLIKALLHYYFPPRKLQVLIEQLIEIQSLTPFAAIDC